ncbi:conserved hypothetical protein [Burkholderia vietnamiensis]|nr:conserved hypothetical protein [Burkholderia vietnamiensis]
MRYGARACRPPRPGDGIYPSRDTALPCLPRRACACTRRANALQSNHAGGVAAAPINLSLKRK